MSNIQMQVQPQAQAVAPKKPMAVLKGILEADSVKAQFANALGKNRDTFIASIIDLFGGDKQLQTCDPSAVVAQCLKAAVMKLPISKALGFAYIVVYNNNVKVGVDPKTGRDIWQKVPTPTFIPGYKGYIQLAMRTGQYRDINADVVYEGEIGKVDKLTGGITFDGERKSNKIIGYFAHFELLNGFRKTLYMTVEDMAAYALRYSPSIPKKTTVEDLIAKANDGTVGKQVGWMGNFNDMAQKTVLRRLLSKFGFLSVEMQGALESDIKQDAAAVRDEVVAETAVEAVVLDEQTYENVDEATGEVLPTADAANAPADDATPAEPEY